MSKLRLEPKGSVPRKLKPGWQDMNKLTRRSVLNGASVSVATALAGFADTRPILAADIPAPAAESARVYKAIPQLGRLRNDVLYGDVWKQPELNPRDRSLVTCAVLAALGKTDELQTHVQLAITNGVKPDELRGMAVQLAFYAGWPAGMALGKAALPLLETKK